MKVQCDVCESAAADFICCADEAALCLECDVKVHAANKLAVKHQRVPLIQNSDSPFCDICQEKTGFFFCLQDRALLCRSCDVSIHSANALSSAHHRFLVTGIRVALEAITGKQSTEISNEDSLKSVASNTSSLPVIVNANSAKAISRPAPSVLDTKSVSGTIFKPHAIGASGVVSGSAMLRVSSALPSLATSLSSVSGAGLMPAGQRTVRNRVPSPQVEPAPPSQKGFGNFNKKNGTLTEYLTETIPGWRVDELLNMQDMAGGCTLAEMATSKVDAENVEDFDWTADLSLFDEQACADSFHEVPELLYGSFSYPRLSRSVNNFFKDKGKQDFATVPEFEDAFTVPDVDFRPPDSPPVIKRRKISSMP